jgi:protein-tyrosine phosphatase
MTRVDQSEDWRVPVLEGGRNFRDLGGYATADGRRVRPGLLFRSGSLSGLAPAAWENLRARGMRTVCDLRTMSERAADPFPWADQEGLTYWAGDYRVSFADLGATLRSGLADGPAASAGMIAGYRSLPFQLAPAYRQLFNHLKADDVPLVVNCAAGKDRAGTAAALILSALGVPRQTVVEDYLLTNTVYDVEAVLRRPRQGHLAQYHEAIGAAIAQADATYILAALEAIDARHGDLAGYLASELGIEAGDLEAIKAHFLE